jgi:hypothetical protein
MQAVLPLTPPSPPGEGETILSPLLGEREKPFYPLSFKERVRVRMVLTLVMHL